MYSQLNENNLDPISQCEIPNTFKGTKNMLESSELWKVMTTVRNNGSFEWTETTEDQFEEMLGVVPPRLQIRNAFIMGEVWRHEGTSAVYACFKCVEQDKQKKYFGCYMTMKEFRIQFGV